MFVDLVSTSRADFSFLFPVARAIARQPGLTPRMVLTGSHPAADANAPPPELAGIDFARVPAPAIGADSAASAHALAAMTAGFAELWRTPPRMCLVLGDRFELLPVVSVAVLYGIPLAHLFGGEEDVAWCLDSQVRDAVTKMAHLHFVSHEATRDRLLAIGEEPWRVHVAGHTALDGPRPGPEPFRQWARERGWGEGPFIASCYHPPTTLRGSWRRELPLLLDGLAEFSDHTVIWTGVNADPEGREVEACVRAATGPRFHYVETLGSVLFPSLLAASRALVGNSSAGLLEAASFGLPVVNLGTRQAGRLSGGNVLSVGADAAALRAALHRALDDGPERDALTRVANPFARPGCNDLIAARVAEALALPKSRLMVKRGVPLLADNHGLVRVPDPEPEATA